MATAEMPSELPSEVAGSAAQSRTPAASRGRIYAMLALGIVSIGLSAIFVKWAQVPGTVSAFWRVAIAAAVLGIPFWRNVRRGTVVRERRYWLIAIAAGAFFVADIGVWNTSLFMTSAANATLLGNDAPILVGLGALILFHERLGLSYWIGLVFALIGMGVIVGRDVLGGSGFGGGDLLAMAAGCFYAAYLLATQTIRAKMDTLSTLWVAGATGAVLLLVFNVVAGRALWGFTPRDYAALLGLGLISQVVGWLAINYALGYLPASIVSVTLLMQPVLTALFAVPLLQEPLDARQLLGGAIALGGIYLVNRGFRKR